MIFRNAHKLSVLLPLLLCACASPTVVQAVKPGDTGLTCAQLQNEYVDAERFRKEAENEKTVTGGNVARAILFWPAILGTAANANEAISAANSRKVHLASQMSQKNCTIPDTTVVSSAVPAAAPIQSKEAKLTELKKLYDANLISKEVYAERQVAILNGSSN